LANATKEIIISFHSPKEDFNSNISDSLYLIFLIPCIAFIFNQFVIVLQCEERRAKSLEQRVKMEEFKA
jgi:hypothetical protein